MLLQHSAKSLRRFDRIVVFRAEPHGRKLGDRVLLLYFCVSRLAKRMVALDVGGPSSPIAAVRRDAMINSGAHCRRA
jgi:hypothetical protein